MTIVHDFAFIAFSVAVSMWLVAEVSARLNNSTVDLRWVLVYIYGVLGYWTVMLAL